MDFRMLYITASDKAEAAKLARALVEARLAACANVLDGATSFYWWEGKVQEEGEALVIAKTRAALVDQAVALVKSLHSYTCPCVVALPLMGGNPDYLAWLEGETEPASES